MVDKKRAATRNYVHEYAAYQGTPEQIKNRSERNKARRIMEKKVGSKAIAGKDIDHKTMIKNGGTNAAGNLRVRSVKANRGWRKGQS